MRRGRGIKNAVNNPQFKNLKNKLEYMDLPSVYNEHNKYTLKSG